MRLFPFYMDIVGKTGLVIGGGTVALRKARKLEAFGVQLIVIAPEIKPEFRTMGYVQCIERRFEARDIAMYRPVFVVAATGDREANRRAARECERLGIMVNVADDASLCTFQFPAMVCRGDMTIGISTGGKSPGAAASVRELIEAALPEDIETMLDEMDNLRERLKRTIPEQEERAAILRKAWAYAIKNGHLPDEMR